MLDLSTVEAYPGKIKIEEKMAFWTMLVEDMTRSPILPGPYDLIGLLGHWEDLSTDSVIPASEGQDQHGAVLELPRLTLIDKGQLFNWVRAFTDPEHAEHVTEDVLEQTKGHPEAVRVRLSHPDTWKRDSYPEKDADSDNYDADSFDNDY